MKYKLFLDDERYPSDNILYEPDGTYIWQIARSYDDFVFLIEKIGLPCYISFDHDLGSKSHDGLHCAHHLVEYHLNNDILPMFEYTVHSQNPIGKNNIESLLDKFKSINDINANI